MNFYNYSSVKNPV
jgi:hypothetical protein